MEIKWKTHSSQVSEQRLKLNCFYILFYFVILSNMVDSMATPGFMSNGLRKLLVGSNK